MVGPKKTLKYKILTKVLSDRKRSIMLGKIGIGCTYDVYEFYVTKDINEDSYIVTGTDFGYIAEKNMVRIKNISILYMILRQKAYRLREHDTR